MQWVYLFLLFKTFHGALKIYYVYEFPKQGFLGNISVFPVYFILWWFWKWIFFNRKRESFKELQKIHAIFIDCFLFCLMDQKSYAHFFLYISEPTEKILVSKKLWILIHMRKEFLLQSCCITKKIQKMQIFISNCVKY